MIRSESRRTLQASAGAPPKRGQGPDGPPRRPSPPSARRRALGPAAGGYWQRRPVPAAAQKNVPSTPEWSRHSPSRAPRCRRGLGIKRESQLAAAYVPSRYLTMSADSNIAARCSGRGDTAPASCPPARRTPRARGLPFATLCRTVGQLELAERLADDAAVRRRLEAPELERSSGARAERGTRPPPRAARREPRVVGEQRPGAEAGTAPVP